MFRNRVMAVLISIPAQAIQLTGFKNKVYECDGELFVVMVHGHVTVIDDEPRAREVLWNCRFYLAKVGYATGRVEGKYTTLHRAILEPTMPARVDGTRMEVDHINHNKLDNRRNNLRWVRSAVNNANRSGLSRANKTGVNGVQWSEKTRRFAATWYAGGLKHSKMFSICKYGSRAAALRAAAEFRAEVIKDIPNYKEALFL